MFNQIEFTGQRSGEVRQGNSFLKNKTTSNRSAPRSCHELSLFIIYLSEAIKSVTGVKCLLYEYDLVLRYETLKRSAEAKAEKALNAALDMLAKWCDFKCRQKMAFRAFSLSHQSFNRDLEYEEYLSSE